MRTVGEVVSALAGFRRYSSGRLSCDAVCVVVTRRPVSSERHLDRTNGRWMFFGGPTSLFWFSREKLQNGSHRVARIFRYFGISISFAKSLVLVLRTSDSGGEGGPQNCLLRLGVSRERHRATTEGVSCCVAIFIRISEPSSPLGGIRQILP